MKKNNSPLSESVSTRLWYVPGLARVWFSPSSPQNCRNKPEILNKGTFIFCAKPWYAPNPGSKEIWPFFRPWAPKTLLAGWFQNFAVKCSFCFLPFPFKTRASIYKRNLAFWCTTSARNGHLQMMPITCRPSSPRMFWEHAHWTKAPSISLLADRSCDFQISLSLTTPCVWAWRWIFWTQPSLNLSRTGLWQTRKFLPKLRRNGQWQILGGSNVCKTSTTFSPQNFATNFTAGKTEFRHFPAMTKIKISPLKLRHVQNRHFHYPVCLVPPSHSPTDLYYLTLASPLYRGLVTVLTVRTKLETWLIFTSALT